MEIPPGDWQDESQWCSVREAAHMANVSQVWIHALLKRDPSPLIYRVVPRGHIQKAAKIYRPSLVKWIASREKEVVTRTTENDRRGRTVPVGAPL